MKMLQNLPLLVQRCCSRDTGIVLQAYYIIKNMDLKKCTVFFLRKITSEDKPNHLMDLEEAFLSLKERKEKTKKDFSVLSRVQTFRHFLKDEVSPQNDTFGKRKKKNLK